MSGWLRKLGFASAAMVAVAVSWWAVVYAQVMTSTDFPFHRTLPCLLYTSDRCSLAMALCKGSHFLGIQRYSAELIWFGAGLALLVIVAEGLVNRPRSSQEESPS